MDRSFRQLDSDNGYQSKYLRDYNFQPLEQFFSTINLKDDDADRVAQLELMDEHQEENMATLCHNVKETSLINGLDCHENTISFMFNIRHTRTCLLKTL